MITHLFKLYLSLIFPLADFQQKQTMATILSGVDGN
jgi:hypothetical protein